MAPNVNVNVYGDQSQPRPWSDPTATRTQQPTPSAGPWQEPNPSSHATSKVWCEPARRPPPGNQSWNNVSYPAQLSASPNVYGSWQQPSTRGVAMTVQASGHVRSQQPLQPVHFQAAGVRQYSQQPIPVAMGYYAWPTFEPWTAPAPMHYPGQPVVYRSSPAPPGPNYGNAHSEAKAPNQGIQADGIPHNLHFIPEVPTGNTTYYCKELDGTWQIRSTNDIMNNCQPGDWRNHSKTGYPYFVRKTA